MGRKEESLTKADAIATDSPRRRSARISVGTRAVGADLTLPSTKSTPDASNDSTNPYISASTTKIDDDMELDEIVVQPKHKSESTSQILKEVAVLMKRSSGPPPSLQTGGGHNRTFTGSPASISSGTTSGVDRLSGYNTPATSTFPTPAESTTGKVSRLDLNSRSTFQNRSRALSTMSMAGKRKRGNAPDTSNDELLAQALQEEEYQELEVLSKRGKTNHHKITGSESVPDSEMEDVDTSDLTSLASLASPTPEPVMQRSRRGRQQTGRTAKLNAKSTIAKNSAEAVPASDLSEETNSDFREDSDVDDFTDDTDAESNFNSETTEDENSVPLNTVSTAPTARRRAAVSVRTARSRATRSRRSGLSKAERERLRLETQHPEIRTMWDDLKAIPILPRKQAKQPLNISRQLKPFQLEGLNWMIQQEKTQWKGGLLGDEMGMGKTIQAVSLIMSDYPAQYPTLVIVPPVALMQWQKEIQDYTDGKLKVLVYHNQRAEVKRLTREDLLKYDVIMISYASLESMHRKEDKGWRRGDDLIKEDSIIHSIHYRRLILDEAHSIKSRQTQTAKACFALTGDYKWCLSGTPVQNRIGEFFSLLRFLEVVPFACYFCKKCRCAELHWSRGEDHRCTHCHCASAQHVSVFNQEILNPITESESQELRREGLAKLRLITDRIMLRRVKRDHTTSMELPPKEVVIHNEFFGEIEHDFSMSIMTNTTRQFDTYVARGVMLNNYANIFGLIMQMRQIANHPDLILKKAVEGASNILVCGICDEPAEEPIRSGCRHVFCRPCLKHFVNTFEDAEGGAPDCPRCHARLTIDWEQADLEQNEDGDTLKKSSIINRINMEKWTSSTKIEMLVYELFKLRSKKQTQKSIVFSQFTSMLQLVEWRLRRCGFNTVMLDGSMTPDQRQKSIDYFMKNVNVEVFLVSLKAGGVALNLTEASRVFIIDPWWNPAAEWQSADRCHRIGQQRPCVVKRLVIEDSVESRMITLQEKKTNMINGTINNDQVAMDKLTPEDMQFLFRG